MGKEGNRGVDLRVREGRAVQLPVVVVTFSFYLNLKLKIEPGRYKYIKFLSRAVGLTKQAFFV